MAGASEHLVLGELWQVVERLADAAHAVVQVVVHQLRIWTRVLTNCGWTKCQKMLFTDVADRNCRRH